jgi:hypothetical protein
MATGEHTLELGDVAFNCNAVGNNPLDFSISASDPLELTLQVTCIISPGVLQIRTFTLGDAPGTDQYLIQVDGGDQHTISEEGAIAFVVPPGEHQLFLDGVPAECTVEGANPLPVTVAPDETIRITFSISCP